MVVVVVPKSFLPSRFWYPYDFFFCRSTRTVVTAGVIEPGPTQQIGPERPSDAGLGTRATTTTRQLRKNRGGGYVNVFLRSRRPHRNHNNNI